MAPPPYQHRDHTVLALFRAVVGLLFACHGAAALFGVFGGTPGAPPTPGQWPGWWAAAIQFAGGTLVLLGVGARSAAVVCSGSMAYAYFVEHQPGALLPIENGGEAAALFCWCFLLIAALGPGRWTLDSVLPGARRAPRRPGHRDRRGGRTRQPPARSRLLTPSPGPHTGGRGPRAAASPRRRRLAAPARTATCPTSTGTSGARCAKPATRPGSSVPRVRARTPAPRTRATPEPALPARRRDGLTVPRHRGAARAR